VDNEKNADMQNALGGLAGERQQYLSVNSIRGFDCFLDLSAQSYRVLFLKNIFTSLIRQC
jgi:hypothetical protein